MKRSRIGNANFKKFEVCLIGLGNVGFGKYVINKSRSTLDHYSAINSQESLELTCVIDKVFSQDSFGEKVRILNKVENVETDLVVVATGTESHLDITQQVLSKMKFRIMLLEKPGTKSLAECLQLKSITENFSDRKIYVNFQRNYNPTIYQVLNNPKLGRLQCGIVHYSNGALNNASHALALLLNIVGPNPRARRLGQDLKSIEEDIDFELFNSEGLRIIFLSTLERNYSNFRIELDFEFGLVTYDSSKPTLNTRMRTQDPCFINKYCLEEIGNFTDINEIKAFENVYDFLVRKLYEPDFNADEGVSLDLATKIHQVFEQLRNEPTIES